MTSSRTGNRRRRQPRATAAVSLLAALLASLLFARPAPAQKVIERRVTGRGLDHREAILDGLVQALQQVNGARIEQKSTMHRRFEDVVADLKESFKSSVVESAEIKTASQGFIESYEVLGQTQDPQSRAWEVEIQARVMVYDPLNPVRAGQRKVIAVVPFRTEKNSYRLYDADVPASKLTGLVSQALVKHLVHSRKFTVLDRDFLAERLGEQKLVESGRMPPQELLRLGQELGADFILAGALDEVYASVTEGVVKLTNRRYANRDARVAVSYRVLNVATGKVHWADTYRRSYGEGDLRDLPPEAGQLRIDELLLENAAGSIAEQVIEGVFPIRVIKVSADGQAVLNQGASRTAPGEELEVFNEGEELIDPDVNEPLEPLRTRVARIRVEQVTPKVSYARVVEGDAAKIDAPNAVCRQTLPSAPPPR